MEWYSGTREKCDAYNDVVSKALDIQPPYKWSVVEFNQETELWMVVAHPDFEFYEI